MATQDLRSWVAKMDAVGEIQATGNNNLVTYRRGLNGANPKVEAMGASNKIVAATQ